MVIEALGSIGSAMGSVASGAGKGVGPAAAGLAKFGPELKGVYLPTIVNEGPVSHADLINTMPILKIGKLNPVKEIRFDEPKRVIEPMVMPRVLPDAKIQPSTEVRVVNRPTQAVSPAVSPAREEQKVMELVEEKKEVEKPKETLEEEKITERKIFVEDIEVSAQRRFDIKVAIKKAEEIAEKLGLKKITGALVAKFMPAEYAGVRSQVVKNAGPDGSYQDTVEEIAGAGEFASEIAAEEKADEVIAGKKPAKYGKNGLPLAFEHVARIFKYCVFKPAPVIEIVMSRITRKKTQVVPQAVETKPEKSLEELDPTLASVFQKNSLT